LLVTGAFAMAQTPAMPPAPTAPPAVAAPAARPAPAPAAPDVASPAARPAPAPRAPAAFLDPDDQDRIREMVQDARDQATRALRTAPPVVDRDTLDRAREMVQDAQDRILAAQDQVRTAQPPMPPEPPSPLYQLTHPGPVQLEPTQPPYGVSRGVGGGIGSGAGGGVGYGAGGGMDFAFNYNFNTPMAFAQNMTIGARQKMNDDRWYDNGLRALDSHRWDEALEDFNQVASHAGPRADGGWYWKAYTLNRLGRRDEALAAIAELRKSYATSRWLDEAKALEIEVRQASGRPVSPEAESDEDLKLMALNGIMQSDPDRAIPLVENILKGSGSHKLKSQALFVLAQNGSPRAQQIVEQIAKGGGNPDLQVKAIEYLGQRRRQSNNSQNQLLMDIYNSTNDLRVKGAIIDTFRNTRDTERLGQIAKTEKNSDLRERTYSQLGEVAGQPELWQLYQAETTTDGKISILRFMHRNGNADKLVEVIKTEKDPGVRRAAISALANQENSSADRLVAIYGSEQDPQLRQAIVDALSGQRSAKYLIDLARAEKDPKLKFKIVERLSNMHSKEASDYLLEILSK
jgi:tetratricopeptide (TPR) repeat protein